MPRVTQTSMSSARTPSTMALMFLSPDLRPRMSRQAAPMQKRVEPLDLAMRAASRTVSTGESLVALRPVVGVRLVG